MKTKKTAKKLKYVIVRCSQAGVHAGGLVSRKGTEVTLKNARRLWQWWSRFTLSDLAMEGPRADKLDSNRYSMPVGKIELLDACEVIECSKVAEKAIRAVSDANR